MKLAADSVLYRRVRWALVGVLAIIAVVPAVTRFVSRAEATAKAHVDPVRARRSLSIAAPGRIQPLDGVVTIAGSASPFGAAVVHDLLVSEGDWVERDQVLAVLNGRDELQAEVAAGERRIDVARAKLIALQAGGKREDVKALRAELLSEEATLAQVAAETRRAIQLHAEHALSAAALEAQQVRLAVATRALEATRARFEGESSVRPADVAVAAAELSAVEADVEAIRTKLASQYIRAPSAGRVLRIHAYSGQAVGPEGLLSFARTHDMFVDAEVTEHDIARARVGQSVRVTGDVLAQPLEGTVERIGSIVGARQVFAIDPTAFADARILHVLIRLKDPAAAERFVNARVTVEIATGGLES